MRKDNDPTSPLGYTGAFSDEQFDDARPIALGNPHPLLPPSLVQRLESNDPYFWPKPESDCGQERIRLIEQKGYRILVKVGPVPLESLDPNVINNYLGHAAFAMSNNADGGLDYQEFAFCVDVATAVAGTNDLVVTLTAGQEELQVPVFGESKGALVQTADFEPVFVARQLAGKLAILCTMVGHPGEDDDTIVVS